MTRIPSTAGSILVRFTFSVNHGGFLTRFDQAFSADGGKTWEVNFIVTETRIK